MNSSVLGRGMCLVGSILIDARLTGGSSQAVAAITNFTGSISNGTSGTFAGTVKAFPGSLVINLTNNKLYINTNTKASPTWTVVGTQS